MSCGIPPDKVPGTAAQVGAVTNQSPNPNLPQQPEEQQA